MNSLKQITLYGIAMLFSMGAIAGNYINPLNTAEDTVIIKFSNNSQIVIYVDNQNDLQNLTQYDINKILEDLNLQVNDQGDSVNVLEIKDETGEKYLKDTTVIYQVKVHSTQEKDKSKYRYHPRSRFDFVLDVGLNNYLENGNFPEGNQPYALNPIGSWYWNLGPTFRTHLFGPVFIDMGMTAALNIYRFDNPRTRLYTDANGVNFTLDNSNVSHLKSKLSTWHIQAKAIPMLAFGSNARKGWRLWNNIDKGFRIGAGPYAGYRIWSRTKYIFDDGGKRKDKKTASHLLSDIRYGIRGQIGIRGVDFFFEYDLNEMFQKNQNAPQLSRIQFGITL